MKIHIITVGSPKLSFAREGFLEYTKRLGGFHDVSVTHLKDSPDAESKALKFFADTYAVLLDENGEQFSSRELSKKIEDIQAQGDAHITFFIGGPNGHSQDMKTTTTHHWALSKLTLPHDLAMLFTAEALYRASTISAGHPYHRD